MENNHTHGNLWLIEYKMVHKSGTDNLHSNNSYNFCHNLPILYTYELPKTKIKIES